MLAESLSPRLTQKPPPQRSGAGASQLLRERVPSPQSHPCKWRLDFPRFRSPSCHQTVGSRGMSTNLHLISIASELGRKRLRGFHRQERALFRFVFRNWIWVPRGEKGDPFREGQVPAHPPRHNCEDPEHPWVGPPAWDTARSQSDPRGRLRSILPRRGVSLLKGSVFTFQTAGNDCLLSI